MSGSPEDLEIGRLEAEVDEIRQRAERAERILAALRKPSEAVSHAVFVSLYGDKAKTITGIICAAVAAAEQEVGRE